MPFVPLVQYRPPPDYALDVELYRGPELRRRAADKEPQIERLDFHVLLYATRPGYTHMIDFETHACRQGSVLLVQPGRVHQFGDLTGFYGWFLIFRSELLPPALGRAELPDHTRLPRAHRRPFTECLARMAADADGSPTPLLNALLNSQLQALLLRLAALDAASLRAPPGRTALQTFQRYRGLVDREHTRWHRVARYARALGCSPKTLTRATREVVGLGAKELLVERLVLEAKRRLAHTATPVYEVADDLGFSEPTNFVKFFRRETGTTPGAFRSLPSLRLADPISVS